MLDSERQLGIIVDLLLPIDLATRYDVYFTDKRIAIVCMGKSDRYSEALVSRPLIFGVTPPGIVNKDEIRKNRQMMEEQINKLTLDEKLKLSKKSCFYSYEEIEAVKLISGKKHKFVILSQECVSKFSPNKEQFKQLTELLPRIEMLQNKLTIFGNLKLNAIPEAKSATITCIFCNFQNDFDAVFCQCCGKQMQEETIKTEHLTEITCNSCGTKNKLQASFCKKCGSKLVV